MPTRARVETKISGSSSGGEMLSVTHWEYPAEVGDPDLTGQANESLARVRAFWVIAAASMLDTARIAVGARVVTVDLEENMLIPATPSAVVSGLASGDALPWHTQGLVKWITGGAVRGSWGRTFIPYLVEQVNVAGKPNATWLTDMNTAVDKMFQPVGLPPAKFILWHRKREARVPPDPQWPERAAFSTEIAGGIPQTKWAYLGSRRD